jgi:glycosyltransferase involved in cell wall biosynthesis
MGSSNHPANAAGKIFLSACIVVYHEEALIRRCLNSIKSLCDEIIVLHDGQCHDRTLTIAHELGAVVTEQERVGEAESQRVAAFETTRGEWILQIDADEFLTEKAIDSIRRLLCNPGPCNGFSLIWPIWNGRRYISSRWPHKPCLFRRSAMHFIGFPHSEVIVDGGIKSTDVRLEHQPGYNNYDFSVYRTKHKKWGVIHTRYLLKEIDTLLAFRPLKHRQWPTHMGIIRRYGRMAIPLNAVILFAGALKSGGWREPYAVFLFYWLGLLYYSDLANHYAKAKSRRNT